MTDTSRLIIRTAQKSDIPGINNLLTLAISEAFARDNITDYTANEEIPLQIRKFATFFGDQNPVRLILVAELDGAVAGTIGLCEPDEILIEHIPAFKPGVIEFGLAYVLPEHQGKGIAGALIREMLTFMEKHGIDQFYLDAGYRPAQQFWTHKLGEPTLVLRDHWGKDRPHMFWHCRVCDIIDKRPLQN